MPPCTPWQIPMEVMEEYLCSARMIAAMGLEWLSRIACGHRCSMRSQICKYAGIERRPTHHARRSRRVADDLVNAVLRRDVHVGVVIPGPVDVARHLRATAADGGHGKAGAIDGIVEIGRGTHAQTS